MKQITINLDKMQKDIEDQIAAQTFIPAKTFMQTVYDELIKYIKKYQTKTSGELT